MGNATDHLRRKSLRRTAWSTTAPLALSVQSIEQLLTDGSRRASQRGNDGESELNANPPPDAPGWRRDASPVEDGRSVVHLVCERCGALCGPGTALVLHAQREGHVGMVLR